MWSDRSPAALLSFNGEGPLGSNPALKPGIGSPSLAAGLGWPLRGWHSGSTSEFSPLVIILGTLGDKQGAGPVLGPPGQTQCLSCSVFIVFGAFLRRS